MAGPNLTAESAGVGPVLLVEDDSDIRQALAEVLEDDGYECVVARHGLEALEALQRETPSLLLVDLVMPVMDGVELIARLRSDKRWSQLPIVVMTADGDRIIGIDLKSLNVPVVRKPVDLAILAQILPRHPRGNADAPTAS